jgi:hypothetical protein
MKNRIGKEEKLNENETAKAQLTISKPKAFSKRDKLFPFGPVVQLV